MEESGLLLAVGSTLDFGGANLFLLKGLFGWGAEGVGWPGAVGPLSPVASPGIFPEGISPGALPLGVWDTPSP